MSEGGFLSRWSRRKQAIARGEAPVEPAPPEAAAPVAALPDDAPVAEPAEEEPFDIASLPSIESLTAESDISGFLARGVPQILKRQALRRIWSLDTGIRDFVGPADYAWDFNAPDGVPGFSLDLPGDVGKLLAQAIGAPPEPEAPAAAETPSMPDVPPAEVEEPQPAPPLHLAEAAPDTGIDTVSAEPDPVPRPRRHGSAMPS
ncbi:DUF3306 domain-containing protein [Roseomonas hellenica]|uniref:DUF3306 domain-containing protein n=1 Tax=Plastoroseomonas hellenica TaxID=2687306 RepID=A0ABS5F2N2_9PROT|nr:DUF3306 domain-containing protein [Plastoroseomonas hellenica]MBR0666776.1 DUF3306 domain-containing protein [Plastoroseomonas hellenica]